MTFFMNRLTVTTQDKEQINTWNEKTKSSDVIKSRQITCGNRTDRLQMNIRNQVNRHQYFDNDT